MSEPPMNDEFQADLDEALLALEELLVDSPEEAITMFDSLPEEVQARAEYRLTLARAHQLTGQLEAARDIAQEVLDEVSSPESQEAALEDGSDSAALRADTHHFLGDVLEDLGDEESANQHFLQTLALDAAHFEPESADTEAALLQAVQEVAGDVLGGLPAHGQKLVSSIVVELFPTAEGVQQGLDPRSYCRIDQEGRAPHRLFVYAANLDAEYGDLDADEFRAALQEEISAALNAALE